MRLPFVLIAAALLVSPAAAAGKYDGVWIPTGQKQIFGDVAGEYSCDWQNENDALAISDDAYGTEDSYCTMKNPVPVDGLNATLVDVTCSGDFGSLTFRELYMLTHAPGEEEKLVIVSRSGASEWKRCPEQN